MKAQPPPSFQFASLMFRVAMIVIGIYLLMQSGCSSAPKTAACTPTDWYEFGRSRAIAGEPLMTSGLKSCNQDELSHSDSELLTNGYNYGLVEFCSLSGGLEAGRRGRPDRKVCPENLAPGFSQGYAVGQQIFKLSLENQNIEKKIAEIFERLSKMSVSRQERDSLQKSLDELRRRRAKNENQMDSIESEFIQRF